MGFEITSTIAAFNKATRRRADYVTVPPIKYGEEDVYYSIIGDELYSISGGTKKHEINAAAKAIHITGFFRT